MIKKTSRFLLVALVVFILLMSLTACGLFDGLNSITKVSIEQKSAWVDSDGDGIYEAELGKYVYLEATWNNKKIKSPSIQWYIQEDGKEKVAVATDGTNKEYTYKVSKRGATVYTISVIINDVETSNVFKFIAVDAKLDAPTIVCKTAGLTLAQGVIQQNIADIVGNPPLNVELAATSNFDDISPDLVIITEWKVEKDGSLIEQITASEYTYDVSSITNECKVTITCYLSYDGLETKLSSIVVLDFVKEYKCVDKVSITSTKSVLVGTTSTYYVEGAKSNPGTITLSTVVYPLTGTDLSRPCTWIQTNTDGEKQLSSTARSIDVELEYGKNTFTAIVDNVVSDRVIVYSLTDSEYSSNNSYILDTYVWNGGAQDHFICNELDLEALLGYIVASHTTEQHNIYVSNSKMNKDNECFGNYITGVSSSGVDESGSFKYSFTTDHISLNSVEGLGNPTVKCPTDYEMTQQKIRVRYKENTIPRTSLPVDSYPEMLVTNSNQLFRAVSWGYKPVIVGNAKLTSIYESAKSVLKQYVSDDMSDVEKVAAIYDWIVTNVEYDHATLDSKKSDKVNNNAFYLEGVFIDHCAVCDGKSKAFTLLCGMEGITSQRIMGYANENLGSYRTKWLSGDYSNLESAVIMECELTTGTPATEKQIEKLYKMLGWGHAWNKVLIDANKDGVKEWYVVDTTWGDASIFTLHTHIGTEYLTYEYFLKTDADVVNNHQSWQKQYEATTEYDPYDNEVIIDGDNEISLHIKTNEELTALIACCSKTENKGVYVLVKVDNSVNLSIVNHTRLTDMPSDVYYIFVN